MPIEGPEKISAVFSIFHDGDIAGARLEKDSLLIEVAIRYLAERIDPAFRTFMLRLDGVKDLCFSTWPNDPDAEPDLLHDATSIFRAELEILEGNFEGNRIRVACNQPSPEFDYCGGELCLSATTAEVTDEAGRTYSSDELDALCEGYWDEWAKNQKA